MASSELTRYEAEADDEKAKIHELLDTLSQHPDASWRQARVVERNLGIASVSSCLTTVAYSTPGFTLRPYEAACDHPLMEVGVEIPGAFNLSAAQCIVDPVDCSLAARITINRKNPIYAEQAIEAIQQSSSNDVLTEGLKGVFCSRSKYRRGDNGLDRADAAALVMSFGQLSQLERSRPDLYGDSGSYNRDFSLFIADCFVAASSRELLDHPQTARLQTLQIMAGAAPIEIVSEADIEAHFKLKYVRGLAINQLQKIAHEAKIA